MASPLVLHPDRTVLLPPRYCGDIGYYALMARYGNAVVDYAMRFDKRQKAVHRTTIADTRGPLTLTVPIAKPEKTSGTRWDEIRVSTHGHWWDVHRVALESAYGRTPFFEFYIDRFLPFFSPRPDDGCETIADLDAALDSIIRDILGISPASPLNGEVDDFRRVLPTVPDVPYYQVRALQMGFVPSLSILDLIFNMGPESPLVLMKMNRLSSLSDDSR